MTASSDELNILDKAYAEADLEKNENVNNVLLTSIKDKKGLHPASGGGG